MTLIEIAMRIGSEIVMDIAMPPSTTPRDEHAPSPRSYNDSS